MKPTNMSLILIRALVAAVLLLPLFVPKTARGAETRFLLAQKVVEQGFRAWTDDGTLTLTLPSDALHEPASVMLNTDPLSVPPPSGYEQVSKTYRYLVETSEGSLSVEPFLLGFPGAHQSRMAVFWYDRVGGTWHGLPTTQTATEVSARSSLVFAQVALFRNTAAVIPSVRLTTKSAVVLDETTGTIVQAKEEHTTLPLASLTKLMTALVVLDQQPDWKARVRYESSDNRIGAALRIRPGEKLTVRDLFFTMLVASANNATMSLVRSTGLDAETFVRLMNEKAAALGLSQTRFSEPTGLDAGNVSTAYEYAMLTRVALQSPLIAEALGTKQYVFRTSKGILHRLRNTNQLLHTDSAVIGGKTGYTDEAGYTLMLRTKARISRDASSLITVVLGGKTSATRFAEARALARSVAQ